MENTQTNVSIPLRKIGRPGKTVTWPESEFKATELAFQNSFSVVTAQSRIKEALKEDTIKQVRMARPRGRGRSFAVYAKS